MGDFLIELGAPSSRTLAGAATALRFSARLQLISMDHESFGLALTFTGPAALWAPHQAPDGSVYAVAGLTAFDEEEWRAAERVPGTGGLAARRLRQLHELGGITSVERVSGNAALIVYDAPRRRLHLVTDPAGAFPVFACEAGGRRFFGSHPDVLARAAGEENRRDEVSLAEFLVASTVTPPFTFYERVRAVDHGVTVTLDPAADRCETRRHFALTFEADPASGEKQLAGELAGAWRDAVRRRTLPRLGRPVVALSGGLDSRLLLASLADPASALAFTCFDQPNRELRTAQALADAAGVPFLSLQRSPDYYAENAESGVRVSGGMGTFANNHFLGVLDRLHAEGMEVMLTGCYCDYLFKGLPLNRRSHWLTGRESLAPFSHEFYFNRRMPDTPLARGVRARWEERFPQELQRQDSDARIFDLEARRTFPLCYEGDNQQRLVPQRLTGWFLPVADRRVLEVYRRIPSRMKLNRSLFVKTARHLLADSPLRRIPDANTGAPLDASPLREWFSFNRVRLQRKLKRRRGTLASDGSWPDWQYYLTHSPKLAELWRRPQAEAEDLFKRVFGWTELPADPAAFAGGRVFQFVPLLTQKIWFMERACSNG